MYICISIFIALAHAVSKLKSWNHEINHKKKKIEPMKYWREKKFGSTNIHEKKFGPTKYAREKISDPRNTREKNFSPMWLLACHLKRMSSFYETKRALGWRVTLSAKWIEYLKRFFSFQRSLLKFPRYGIIYSRPHREKNLKNSPDNLF